MAHAIRYFCSWETEVYKHQMRLELWEKDYVGEATAMVLSGEPKLTMEEGDTICGSSLDFGLLSETNGQYLHLYTTDNHKYLIKILRDSAVMWEGYLLPEYYSEAYIAAPYTVSFTATDWLGMLKNVDFPAEDTRVPILQIIKTCLQYTELPLDFACQLDMRVEGINDTTNVLGALYLNPMTFTGYNCYEVLEKILASFNATLRQMGHRWLISSIDDDVPLRLISWDSLTYTGDGESNNGELIDTNFDGTFIDGSLAMVISPAKKSVDLSQDVFYRESWLKDYDFHSADAWELHGNILKRLPGWLYTKNPDDGQLIKQTYVEYLRVRPLAIVADNNYISQVINVEGAPDNSEFTLGIKFLTPTLLNGDNTTVMYVKIINRSSTSLTQDVAYLSVNGWTNEDSEIELNGTSTEPEYLNSRAYYDKDGNLEWAYKKDNWPITKINFISIPYSGTLEIRIRLRDIAIYEKKHPLNPQFSHYFGGVYLTKTNVNKNLTISSTLNPDAAETASSVNLMLCDSPEERNVELGVLNYFSLSDGALTTGKKWYYNGLEYEDFLHAIAYSYSRCYANKRQKLSGALYTDKIYNLCSFTDKWSGKRHTIKSWIYSIISERLDSMEIIETPAKEIELTLSTPEAGSSNKQNQPSGGTSGGGSTSMAGSGRYVNLDTAQEVSGEKTWNDNAKFKKNINVVGDGIFGGEVVAIAGDAEPIGVTNYAQLKGKPSINGKELASGNNTLDELGIQPKGDYTTASQLATTLENYATKVFVSNNYASKSVVNTIQALIPATASADNQLADKDFVNSSIATATAEFRGSFTSLDELKATSGNLNDYAFYLHTDSVGNSIVDRYKWTTAGWLYEYTLNNSSFTAEQWAAINSTITATLVNSYNSHLNNTTIHITAAERTAWNNKWDYNEETIKGVKVNAAANADYASNAASANGLVNEGILDSQEKIDNFITKDRFKYALFKTADSNNVGFSSNDGMILSMSWSSTSYGAQMAFDDTTDGTVKVRGKSSSWGNWYKFLHSGNYNSYSPKLDGTGASGTWGISISGNAATATKLQSPRTLWGKPFDGSADVSGDLKDVGNITASGKATIQGDIISGGEVVAVAGEGTPSGVTDYSELTGKPSINGVTLVSGNNTLAALGIQAAGDYATNSGVTTLLADYAKKTFVANNYASKSAFNSHTADTDIHITSAERTAWNAKWDYNEAIIKAVKVTSASSADSVAWSGIKNKPTTFTPSAHTHTASDVSGLPTSLKNPYALTFGSKTYDGSAAKTITASDLGALTAHQTIYALTLKVNGTSQGVYNPASAAKTINITVPTKTSQITNDSGFITSASIPTALKNPYAVEIKANGVSLGTYDGSKAATFNLSAANVGAANKIHTHTASEVSGLPTKLSAFTNDVGFITGITKSMVEGVLTGDITSHTHSYLPLSGGTLTSANPPLHINRINGFSSILYQVDGATVGILGFDQNGDLITRPHFQSNANYYNIIHAGNYNSYAPTLTGTGASGTWGINISGNAASATKLQTPRTIWGKSFDGSANVSGDLSLERYRLYWNGDINGSYISSDGMKTMIYDMRDGHIFQVGGYEILRITRYSNYKLKVKGKTHIAGDLVVDGEVSALVA